MNKFESSVQSIKPEIDEMESFIKESKFRDLTGIIERIAGMNLPKFEQSRLLKLIKKTHKEISITDLREDIKSCTTSKGQMNPLGVAHEVLREHYQGGKNLIHNDGKIYEWDGSGVWVELHKIAVNQTIQHHIGDTFEKVTSSQVNDISGLITNDVHHQESIFFGSREQMVNLNNGTLKIKQGEWTLDDHKREDYLLAKSPHNYVPSAKCPQFEAFLNATFEPDQDTNEKVNLIYELFGYSLTNSTAMEKFVILVGTGSNGKSLLLNILTELVGKQNTCSISPEELGDSQGGRFARGYLYGKLVNTVSELQEGKKLPASAVKAVASGDQMKGEGKGTALFDFKPYATQWFGTNHLPIVSDYTNGFARKAIVIEFNLQLSESQQDKELFNKLSTELEGILYKSLQAYSQAIKRNHFKIPASVAYSTNKWLREANQVARFLDECTVKADSWIEFSHVYIKFIDWAESEGIPKNRVITHKPTFSKRLTGLNIETKETNKDGRTITMVYGVSFKPY